MRVAQARATDVPRSLRFGKFGFNGFAAAGKCANALTDAGQFFRGVRRLEQGIQFGQGAYNVYDGRGGPDIALDVWVTQEQEGWNGERLPRHLLLFHNPDTQSSVWATPPDGALI